MPSHRFLCPDLIAGINTLPAVEAHHAAVVMRCRPGDAVELFDGQGHVADGVIESVTRRDVRVTSDEIRFVPFELSIQLTLAVAMSKTHRQGYLVEKCTELGVAAVWPLLSERSVTRPGEAALEKWSRRAIEAVKQSGRAWVPVISPVAPFTQALMRTPEFATALFCDFGPEAIPIGLALEQRKPSCKPSNYAGDSVIAFVGPEGGWSEQERAQARSAGLTAIRLSPTILRAETAAVALCASIAAKCAESI